MVEIYQNEIKKDEEIVSSPPLQDNAMYLQGQSRVSNVGGVSFGDSAVGTRKLVPIDGSEIQKAVDNLHDIGGGVVFLKNGTHLLTSDIILYSNIYLEGENADSTILDFQNNAYGIQIVGTNAYSAGTVSISNNSQTLTGSSTSWSTNVVAGMYVLLGGIWYPIAVVGSDTSITISIPYAGVTLAAGTSYTIAAIKNDVKVLNLTIKNASSGIKFQYANEQVFRDVNIQTSVTGIDGDDSSQTQFDQIDLVANNASLDLSNVHFTKVGELGSIDALAGNGITLTGVTNSSFQSCFVQNSSGDGMNLTNCSNLNIFGSFVENGGQGVEFVSGNSDVILIGGAYENNGSDGIKLTATTDNCQFIGNSIKDNGGYGVNVAASSCDGNNITGNNFSGNVTANHQDLGTGTLLRGNVGVNDNSTGIFAAQIYDIFGYFGTGADGVGTADGSTALAGATLASNVYTLTRDVFYTNLTINSGITLVPAGYMIYGTGTLTNNGTIRNNGGNGGVGGNGQTYADGGAGGSVGVAGTAALGGTLAPGTAGSAGGAGGGGGGGVNGDVGTAGTNKNPALGSNGVAGGAGGGGGNGASSGGAGGAGGTSTSETVVLKEDVFVSPTTISVGTTSLTKINRLYISGSSSTTTLSVCAGSGGAGGGGTGSFHPGGGGGGGGSGGTGGIVFIIFPIIVVGASSFIYSNGGTGGNGGNADIGEVGVNNAGSGGGGGGGGGNGGIIFLVYKSYTNNGTVVSTGGSGGTGGVGAAGLSFTGDTGATGTSGNSGKIYQVSMAV